MSGLNRGSLSSLHRLQSQEESVSLPASAFEDIMKRLTMLETSAQETAAENRKLHQQLATLKGEDEPVVTKLIQLTAGMYEFEVEVPEDKEDEFRDALHVYLRVGANALKSYPKAMVDAPETQSSVLPATQDSMNYFEKLPALTKDVIWTKPDSQTISGYTVHCSSELMSVIVKDAGDDNYSFLQNIGGYECIVTAGALFSRVLLLSGWRTTFNLEQKAVLRLLQPTHSRRQSNNGDRRDRRTFEKTLKAEVARAESDDGRDTRVFSIPRRPTTPPMSSRVYFNRTVDVDLENA
jgi:hypothetical protein